MTDCELYDTCYHSSEGLTVEQLLIAAIVLIIFVVFVIVGSHER